MVKKREIINKYIKRQDNFSQDKSSPSNFYENNKNSKIKIERVKKYER